MPLRHCPLQWRNVLFSRWNIVLSRWNVFFSRWNVFLSRWTSSSAGGTSSSAGGTSSSAGGHLPRQVGRLIWTSVLDDLLYNVLFHIFDNIRLRLFGLWLWLRLRNWLAPFTEVTIRCIGPCLLPHRLRKSGMLPSRYPFCIANSINETSLGLQFAMVTHPV